MQTELQLPGASGDGDAERIAHLRAELERHTLLYYRDAKPEIPDSDFDAMMAELAALERKHPELADPNSPTQRVGGAPTEGFEPFEHLLPMQSLENTYDESDLDAFDASVRAATGLEAVPYVVEPKIDGLAFCAVYEHGAFAAAATRGDGLTGDNVSACVRGIRALPLHVATDAPRLEVRGEIYLPKKTFADMVAEATENPGIDNIPENPRNAAAGLVTGFGSAAAAAPGSAKFEQKKLQAEFRRRLAVVLYGLGWCQGWKEPDSQSGLLEALRELGFPSQPAFWRCSGIAEVRRAIEELGARRHEFPFEMDGAVVKVDDRSLHAQLGATAKAPRWARAFKYAPERAESIVEAITVQVGRTGVLTPVAELRAVRLAGTTVARATLHNEDDVRRKDIRVGDRVWVEKAGEIIPAIVGVRKELRTGSEQEWHMPETCPACGHPVSRTPGEVAVRCTNLLCPAQLETRIVHFASPAALDLEGVGPDVAKALVSDKGIRHPIELFSLLPGEWRDLRFDRPARKAAPDAEKDAAAPASTGTFDFYGSMQSEEGDERPRFGEKRAQTVLDALAKARSLPLSRWIAALGIPDVGEAVSRDAAKIHRDLRDLAHSEIVSAALRLHKLQDKLAELSPNSRANRALGLAARVANAEAYEKTLREAEELGERLVREGVGSRLKSGGAAPYTCVIKPEAARALRGYFESEDGKTFMRGMEAMGINPVGGAAAKGAATGHAAESAQPDGATAVAASEAPPSEAKANDAFTGRTIVVTGTFHDLKRKELERMLLERGAKIVASVSKNTDMLVVGKNPGADKTAAARRFGTSLLDESALRAALGLPPVVEQGTLF